jgi:hypothetical protein
MNFMHLLLKFKVDRYQVGGEIPFEFLYKRSLGVVGDGRSIDLFNFCPEYPSISRGLLAVHAAVAKIFHEIGAGTEIDGVMNPNHGVQPRDNDVSLLTQSLSSFDIRS